jgi:hypothetical protein
MAGRESDTFAQAASASPSTMAATLASIRLPKGVILSFPDLRSHDSEVYCSTDLTYAQLAMQIRLVTSRSTVTFMFMLLNSF